jgi:hypothetical protein
VLKIKRWRRNPAGGDVQRLRGAMLETLGALWNLEVVIEEINDQ